jgi:hypothetical protein
MKQLLSTGFNRIKVLNSVNNLTFIEVVGVTSASIAALLTTACWNLRRSMVTYDSHVRRTGSTDTIASSWRQLAVLDMVSYKIPVL